MRINMQTYEDQIKKGSKQQFSMTIDDNDL